MRTAVGGAENGGEEDDGDSGFDPGRETPDLVEDSSAGSDVGDLSDFDEDPDEEPDVEVAIPCQGPDVVSAFSNNFNK